MHGMCELTWLDMARGTAWAWHGLCELAVTVYFSVRSSVAISSSGQSPTKPKKIFFLKKLSPKTE
jgi:hypothetical protein